MEVVLECAKPLLRKPNIFCLSHLSTENWVFQGSGSQVESVNSEEISFIPRESDMSFVVDAAFDQEKSQRLGAEDLSRKGSIDEPISNLISCINEKDNYFSTSSCSGRVITYEISGSGKPGCKFIDVFHSTLLQDEVARVVSDVTIAAMSGKAGDKVYFKYEPLILHVRAKTLEAAVMLCKTAIESGLRNSGITFGKNGRTLVAIRSSHSLEVPIASDGSLLVSEDYIKFLCSEGNARLAENFARIMKFEHRFKTVNHNKPERDEHLPPNKRRDSSIKSCKDREMSFQDEDFHDAVETLFPGD
ncbi:unnamed protein product [Notodromas monacha]|uniref:tRNA wybutosine-synthesizing protein 3 homolog n=1 Tax=Notodromas monacha TaxID=399045 RepID=A0A7R9G9T2_9CRUS|nr:unnamed protein product [Notodromas monacha]CAG0914617.1 unnamed protein product [Notodromas monacha]